MLLSDVGHCQGGLALRALNLKAVGTVYPKSSKTEEGKETLMKMQLSDSFFITILEVKKRKEVVNVLGPYHVLILIVQFHII